MKRSLRRSLAKVLLAIVNGVIGRAEIGPEGKPPAGTCAKLMERRRVSSKLPEVIDRLIAPLTVHAGTISKTLGITPLTARRIVSELGLR